MLTPSDRREARILIVDDEPHEAARIARMLTASGYSAVKTVHDPTNAAEVYRDFEPDGVLLDVHMPDVDGFEVMRRLEEIAAGSYLPVLMVVPSNDRDTRLRALSSAASDILTKPLDEAELIARLATIVETRLVYRALSKRKSRLESVLDATDEAVALFDIDETLMYSNRQFAAMFGLDEPPPIGVPASDLRDTISACFHDSHRFEESDAGLFEHPDETFEDTVDVVVPQPRVLHRLARPVYGESQLRIGRLVVYRDVSKELEVADMKAEVTRLRAEMEKEYSFGNMIGRSDVMRRMYALMEQASHSDITVLIQGESGSGKELVAKGIHAHSSRKRGPFVAINCAAIPVALMESELFGHERGAFTGAHMRRVGRFEQAKGGTIFLDEAGDMPLELQAKLLRVLQEREIQRVGGMASIAVDVRVIAATNQDVEQAVADGSFREDLFYRLAVFPIVVPPLRERREDIPLIAENLLGRHAEAEGRDTMEFAAEAMKGLVAFDWPGNVRQLDNAIRRAVVVASSNVIHVEDLPDDLRGDPAAPPELRALPEGFLTFRAAEKEVLVRAIQSVGTDARQCAAALGIGRATFYRMLSKHRLTLRR